MVLVVSMLAAGLSYEIELWYFPMVGGFISLSGIFFRKRLINNIGILVTGGSFYLLNRNLPFTSSNILKVLGIFFLLYASWKIANSEVLLRSIKKDTAGEEMDAMLREYRRSSMFYLTFYLSISLLLSFISVYTARYSYLDIELGPKSAIPFSILFGLLFFFIIFLIVEVLPEVVD